MRLDEEAREVGDATQRGERGAGSMHDDLGRVTVQLLQGLVGRKHGGHGDRGGGGKAEIVARVDRAAEDEVVELADLDVRVVGAEELGLAGGADALRLERVGEVILDFLHELARRAPGIEVLARLEEQRQAGGGGEFVGQQEAAGGKRLEDAEVEVAVQGDVERDLRIGVDVGRFLEFAAEHFKREAGGLDGVEDAAAPRVMLADLADEGERAGWRLLEFARHEAEVEGGQPVQVLQAGLGEPVRMVARVVEDDEVEGLGLRVIDDVAQRRGQVMRVADEENFRAVELGEAAREVAAGGVGLDDEVVGLLVGGEEARDLLDVVGADGGLDGEGAGRRDARVGVRADEDLFLREEGLPVGVLMREEEEEGGGLRRGSGHGGCV